MADSQTIKVCEGPFEIVSLVGVIASPHAHLHISLSDSKGQVIGGHLVEDDIIYTTAELVITELCSISLERKPCQLSGWDELVVKE
ncbi:hypothetical protein EB796_013960 [Bugula neritina]|uniref:PPC domain-containing protein n=1 Tax=Bugula neritina TaxID=10212 RepID=A0A7J7JP06_BUGNE|nr:hypothetical protein EB796_013960 [Bugula neritina]